MWIFSVLFVLLALGAIGVGLAAAYAHMWGTWLTALASLTLSAYALDRFGRARPGK